MRVFPPVMHWLGRLIAWAFGLMVVLVLTVLVASLVFRPVDVALRTALLMPDLFAFQPYRPSVLVSREPRISAVTIPDRPLTSILYLPASAPPHGALVLTLGVHPVPPDDPSVTRLADGLARAGVAVLVVQSDDLVADRIQASEVDNLVAAFEFMRLHPEIDADRIGMFGFSAGASLAALAAADERIRDDIAVLGWFGGFADIQDMILAISTYSFVPLEPVGVEHDPPRVLDIRATGDRVAWQPDTLSRYIFVKQLIDEMPVETDREVLAGVFLLEPGVAVDPRSLPHDPPAGLTPVGRTVYLLLVSDEASRVGTLIGELPDQMTRHFATLSPVVTADGIRATTFIMHDRSDQLVPFSQSVKFAAALPPTTPTHLTLFDLFEHVRPQRPVSLVAFVNDVTQLYWSVYGIILILDV